jgi:hypothetical protein
MMMCSLQLSRYVAKLSRSLYVKYKSKGIDIQYQVRTYVAKLSKIS